VAPLFSSWLYGSSDPDDLDADQKETLSSILSLTSTAIGATTGNTSDAIAAGQASENAVENNFFTLLVDPDEAMGLALEKKYPVHREGVTLTNSSSAIGNMADVSIILYPPSAIVAAPVGFLASLVEFYATGKASTFLPGIAGSFVGKTLKVTNTVNKQVIDRASSAASLETNIRLGGEE
jgi:hypothetical protein